MLKRLMSTEVATYLLLCGVLFGVVVLATAARAYRLPDNHQDYEPVQPIAYSHRLHAGELAIDCRYCHDAADQGRHAGIPEASVCMNCHKFVTAPLGALRAEERLAEEEGRPPARIVSPELAKLYAALGLDDGLMPDSEATATGISWVKIHNLPDYVYFDHRAHVVAGVSCQTCHGPVETMERVRQVEDLSMGWCVNCHRTASETGVEGRPVHAPVDCTTCHY